MFSGADVREGHVVEPALHLDVEVCEQRLTARCDRHLGGMWVRRGDDFWIENTHDWATDVANGVQPWALTPSFEKVSGGQTTQITFCLCSSSRST